MLLLRLGTASKSIFNDRCCLEYMPCLENEVVVTNIGGRVLGILRVGCWCFSGTNYGCADAQI
jgi:hypothetical protein